jgi:hypothetical protein
LPAQEPVAKSKCLFCSNLIDITHSHKHHHWYENIRGTYHYNFYFADINDIMVCNSCFPHVKGEDIKIPNHIPEFQWKMYAVKYLRRQYGNTNTKLSGM